MNLDPLTKTNWGFGRLQCDECPEVFKYSEKENYCENCRGILCTTCIGRCREGKCEPFPEIPEALENPL